MPLDTTPLPASPAPGSYTHDLPRTTINDVISKAVQDPASAEAFQRIGLNWQLSSITGANRAFIFDSSIVMADPGAGRVRLNNANPAAATMVAFSATTTSGVPFGSLLKNLVVGDFGVINGFNTQTNALLYRLTGVPVDLGTYFTAQIQSEGAGGAFANGMIVSTDLYEVGSRPPPPLKNDRTTAVVYSVFPPTLVVPGVYPTSFSPVGLANDVDVTVSFQYTSGGETNALFEQTTAAALTANPNVWIPKTSQPRLGTGDASFHYRYNSVADEIEVSVEFDGGVKVPVSLTVTTGYNTPVPV